MALAARASYEFQPGGLKIALVVLSGEVIFDGALVGVTKAGGGSLSTDGYAQNWGPDVTGEMIFVGMARITDQNSGDGTDDKVTGDGTLEIEVDISGPIIKNATVAGLDNINDVCDVVYASDDNTLTLTATTGSTEIGIVTRYSGTSGTGDVHLFPFITHAGSLIG